jgi:transposase
MEACGSSHHWGRWFAARGHTTRLIAAEFVKPFRPGGKNDTADAEAIAVAARQPTMRFVAIKSVEQQAILAWHSVREGWQQERTALLNRTRGLLAEFGVVFARSAERFLSALPYLIEDARLPDPVRAMLQEVREQLAALHLRLARCDQQIASHARSSDVARRAGELLGIGPLTSSALAATVPDAKVFRNGRQFGAWLGLTPRQHSSGGRDAARTYQPARQRLPAHAARSGCPKYVAVSVACQPHARQPPATMDQATPRTQGVPQDVDCDCQQARPHAVGHARQE